MGITGLLPLLKPIQRQKHLSEFAGQTLAVDAYVWLHRGTYACAPELVQGRPTRKYVDYCMHRVRLLRHHHISPFLVFDGGPLPAKQGTEKEREKKRADNVKRANELSAQGKESQAREYYVKCVDVTPQMAYQVIKALKAEGVPYIVAPYEADAQLAYLERVGLVDGIITEDSDLLVFGCRNVLFKLDPVSSTITNISRSEFGSPALASDSLSLVGWSDAQFRWMAMLSGCDYLPSISGIGLKTAWQLIKRHKTVDKVVKMIRLEGKKDVPRRYLDAFYLAEKVFLHQRVYDPGLEKLVYLTNPSDDLDLSEEAESYIGRDLDPSLAKRIAEGDACPISLADMEDINPSFTPKAIKPLPLQSRDTNSTKTPKGKQLAKGVGLLSFFSATTKTPPTQQKPCPTKRRSNGIVTGDASGKRTLMDVMEQDVATKRKKVEAEAEKKHEVSLSFSRFFHQRGAAANYPAGPSRAAVPDAFKGDEKENAAPEGCTGEEDEESVFDPVAQEDGYISPSPCLSRNSTPDLSSPIAHTTTTHRKAPVSLGTEIDPYDLLSSPSLASTLHVPRRMGATTQESPTQDAAVRVLVRGSPEPFYQDCEEDIEAVLGPDLALNFEGDNDDDVESHSEPSSEILCWDNNQDQDTPVSGEEAPYGCVTPLIPTQIASQSQIDTSDVERVHAEIEEIWDDDEEMNRAQKTTHAKVAQGWATRFSFGSPAVMGVTGRNAGMQMPLSTPKASQFGRAKITKSASAPRPRPDSSGCQAPRNASGLKPRKSDPYPLIRPIASTATSFESRDTPIAMLSDDIEEVVCSTKSRLESFRFSR